MKNKSFKMVFACALLSALGGIVRFDRGWCRSIQHTHGDGRHTIPARLHANLSFAGPRP